ncbi:MAG: ELWxxDGT repeat protein [Thermoanaerobaculia bacterium]
MRLVKDIAPPYVASSGIQFKLVDGARVLFTASALNSGQELWVTDGTTTGTRLIKDATPGTPGTHFSTHQRAIGLDFVAAGGFVYWRRSGEINQNFELWRTDGSASGSSLELTLGSGCGVAPGLDFAPRSWAAPIGDDLFFIPATCSGRVWKFDSSTRTASPVTDFNATQLFKVNGRLVTVSDTEIRVSDESGTFSSTSSQLWTDARYIKAHEVDGGLALLTSNPGSELWLTDGTAAGTYRRASFTNFSPSRILGATSTDVFFEDYDDLLVVSIATGAITSIQVSEQILDGMPLGDALIFSTIDGSLSNTMYSVWRSEGTPETTHAIRALGPGPLLTPPSFVRLGDKLVFVGTDPEHGGEPWVTDGTPDGTLPIADLYPGPTQSEAKLVVLGSQLLIAARHEQFGHELWISDGLPSGDTRLIANIADDTGSSRPSMLTTSGTRLYFQAYQPDTAYEPFVSDGTAEGTGKLIDFIPGSFGLGFTPMGTVGGKFFFNMRLSTGADTFVTEGTAESTRRLGSEIPFFQLLQVARSLALHDRIVFLSTNGKAASTDGTPGGTVLLSAIGPTIPIVGFRGYAFLGLNDPSTRLFRTDGTVEGTARLSTASYSYPATPQVVDDKLFFRAYESSTGGELWLTEGTAESTRLVADSNPGSAWSTFQATAPLSGRLYYFANSAELWTSDGTDAGTHSVAPLPGVDYQLLFSTGSRLLFFAKDDAGWELWSSDGTATGSARLVDICAGPGSSVEGITRATMIDGVLHFAADDCVNGLELWKSDGTSAGTMRVTDIAPGIQSSSPASFAKVGDEIYFSAYRPDVGIELFAYRPELETSSTILTATPSTIALGDSVELEAVVSHSGTVTPNGAVEFIVDGEVLKTVPITGGSATATIASLAGGAHSIVARYVGDAFIARSTSQAESILVSARPATLSATPSAVESIYGTILSVSAVVEGVFTSPHFLNGVVVVREGAQQLGGSSIANGVATITLPILSAGTHHLTVAYERDSSFAANDVTVTVNVSVLEATLTINGLSPIIEPSTTMNLQSPLSRANQAPLLGKLRLLDGGQLLREAPTGATVLYHSMTGLSVGVHQFVVEYVGDPNITAPNATAEVYVTNFPTLTSTTPLGVCRGQQLFDFLINGNYFDATAAVTLNDQPLSTQLLSATQLRASNTNPLPPINGSYLGIARADGASRSWGLPFHDSYAAPVVTAPPALVVVATETVDRVQAVTAAASPALAAWLDSGSATDDCSYVAPERLPRTISGVPVTPTTPIFYGNLNIQFPYRDSAGNAASAPASLRVIPRGSLDGNVVVNATDMVILANYLVGNIQHGSAPFSSPLEAGDLNADGRVNSVDLVILANLLVGNITVIPAI